MGNVALLPLTKRLVAPNPEVRRLVAKARIELGPDGVNMAATLIVNAAGRRLVSVQVDSPETITQFFVGLSDSDESVRTPTSMLVSQMGTPAQRLLQEWRAAGSPVVKPKLAQ